MAEGKKYQKQVEVEICCCSINSALAAFRGGAYRVELCDNLYEGGTTPSSGSIRTVRNSINCKLHVIIRPRGCDFLFNNAEFEAMLEDVKTAQNSGADGVVIGILNADGTVDYERNARLIEAAGNLSVTFHRAFDMTRDLPEALEVLVQLGVERVLTTGGCAHPLENLPLLRNLQTQGQGRIEIMVGGSSPFTLQNIVRATGVNNIHMLAAGTVESGMQFRNHACTMGISNFIFPEYSWPEIDENMVRQAVKMAEKLQEEK